MFEITTGQTLVAAGWGAPDEYGGTPKWLKMGPDHRHGYHILQTPGADI